MPTSMGIRHRRRLRGGGTARRGELRAGIGTSRWIGTGAQKDAVTASHSGSFSLGMSNQAWNFTWPW